MWDLARAKQALKTYGRAGAVTYLGLSTMVTTGGRRAARRAACLGLAACSPPLCPSPARACRFSLPTAAAALPVPTASRASPLAPPAPGFYVAIKNNVDVKKIAGIKGARPSGLDS
jgi:hypothetical protein